MSVFRLRPLAALLGCFSVLFSLSLAAAAPGVPAATAPARPARAVTNSLPQRYRGQIIRKRVRFFPRKLLALTFDDGPDPAITPQVLATLRQHGAHATFFVLGKCARTHPELVRQAAREGHAIGSHSYSHAASTTPAQAAQELQQTAGIIGRITGEKPVVFRPPYGITKGNLCRTAQQEGYAVILWTISSADSNPINATVIAHNVIHTPNPGEVILMHDGQGHVQSARALDQILTELTRKGFTFVTVPQLLTAWDRWLADHPQKPGAARPKH